MARAIHMLLGVVVSLHTIPALGAPRPVRVLQPVATISDRIHVVDAASGFERGCFDPCQCIWSELGFVRGTFRLMYLGSGGGFREYGMEDVSWIVSTSYEEIAVVGSGTYRVGREANTGPLVHRLQLDLQVGDLPVARFDSGVIPAQNALLSDITLSTNGMYCYDTVFRLKTRPVTREEVVPYHMLGGSVFERGCYDPCDCASPVPLPVAGSMGLIALVKEPWLTEYAVVRVHWQIPGDNLNSSAERRPITGSGFWRYAPANATDFRQELSLNLRVGDEPPAHFESGWIPYDGAADIVAPVSINGMVCFDTVIRVMAGPGH